MRYAFIGVWSETRREFRIPLINQPRGEDSEDLAGDIF